MPIVARNPKTRHPFEWNGVTFYVRAPRHFEIEEIRRENAEISKALPSRAVLARLIELNADVAAPGGAERLLAFAAEHELEAKQLQAIVDKGRLNYNTGCRFLVGWRPGDVVDDKNEPVLAELADDGWQLKPSSIEMLPREAVEAAGAYAIQSLASVDPKSLGKSSPPLASHSGG